MPDLPEPSKSPVSTPIPARAFPSVLNARPASTATSLNLPLRRLRYSLLGCVSLATSRSGQPSDRKSTRSELQSPYDLVCRLLLEKKNKNEHEATRIRQTTWATLPIELADLPHRPHDGPPSTAEHPLLRLQPPSERCCNYTSDMT